MQIEDAYAHVQRSLKMDVGRFYEPGNRLTLGKGCIDFDVPFAMYDADSNRYLTVSGRVYILTHECDVDEGNDRLFNTDVLVCPILPLEDIVAEYSEVLPENQLASFLNALGARRISRLAYLPPIPEHLPYGGVMYLNQITNGPAEAIRNSSKRVCSVTAFGLREIEYLLENHLLRPKADRLALSEEPVEVK